MRILADTSIWIMHLRMGVPGFDELLQDGEVLAHPFVVGELALGNMASRSEVLEDLRMLPEAIRAADDEVLQMIEHHALHGRGIGYVDAHLLLSTRLTQDVRLWTLDRRLEEAAHQSGVAANLPH